MNSIGSSVRFSGLKDKTYVSLLTEHFDYWYPDNGFRWQEKGKTESNSQSREIVTLANQRGKSVRGNNLTSATNVIVKKEVTEWEVKYHLEKTMEQFPEIEYWDAVHESTTDNGYDRNCVWKRSLGEDWEADIFRWAHEINPNAKLFYCDYFRGKNKWLTVHQKAMRWLGEGVPIHGISVQLHSNLRPSVLGKNASLGIKEAEWWMKKFKDLGLLLHVPEIVVWQPAITADIRNFQGKADLYKEVLRKGMGDFLLFTEDVEELQSKVYAEIAKACMSASADMIGFWSAFDTYPWNWVGNRARAGFWDENYKPKKNFKLLTQ
ncbi:endo-1,4-beta-xylanase [Limnofasciculus baicalensis]|uniref:endo-1,4-beta-xylanase n=1 Tax=Limnofasciculus baicalensis BBK-W-15 TaxID=2699891 RepID=A0AAE3GMI3_9CYAN|nr:endo-1,4-beta-xylanase [Limnofasciculus baicalensis]MCP2727340.1 endo-1,4-beta-xylanase [Limnofasciculus baicalensis BBK-W-15]